jgi:hypothetical protein
MLFGSKPGSRGGGGRPERAEIMTGDKGKKGAKVWGRNAAIAAVGRESETHPAFRNRVKL